jgi:hypothetical protein
VIPASRSTPRERALRRFFVAVVAFSDDPGPDNLERYLEASRALEEGAILNLDRDIRPAGEKRRRVGEPPEDGLHVPP